MNAFLCVLIVLISFARLKTSSAVTNINENSTRVDRAAIEDMECANKFLEILKKKTVSVQTLPSKHLLITSSTNDIVSAFKDLLKNKESSKIIKSCGKYSFLPFVKIVSFLIHNHAKIADLKNFANMIISKNACIEFDKTVKYN